MVRPLGRRPRLRRARGPGHPSGGGRELPPPSRTAPRCAATRCAPTGPSRSASASRCCWSRSSERSSCATAAASTRPSPPRSSAWPRWPSPIRSRACATIAPSTRTSRASCSASAAPACRWRWSCSTSTTSRRVNDTHGHQAGDERLQALADAIRATGRGADLAYRVGGDEFAVILPDARAWGGARVRPAPARGHPGRRARRRALHHDGRHLRGARAALARTS